MLVPSTAALLALAALCFEQVSTESDAERYQNILKNPKQRAKYRAACPAYENYAQHPQ